VVNDYDLLKNILILPAKIVTPGNENNTTKLISAPKISEEEKGQSGKIILDLKNLNLLLGKIQNQLGEKPVNNENPSGNIDNSNSKDHSNQTEIAVFKDNSGQTNLNELNSILKNSINNEKEVYKILVDNILSASSNNEIFKARTGNIGVIDNFNDLKDIVPKTITKVDNLILQPGQSVDNTKVNKNIFEKEFVKATDISLKTLFDLSLGNNEISLPVSTGNKSNSNISKISIDTKDLDAILSGLIKSLIANNDLKENEQINEEKNVPELAVSGQEFVLPLKMIFSGNKSPKTPSETTGDSGVSAEDIIQPGKNINDFPVSKTDSPDFQNTSKSDTKVITVPLKVELSKDTKESTPEKSLIKSPTDNIDNLELTELLRTTFDKEQGFNVSEKKIDLPGSEKVEKYLSLLNISISLPKVVEIPTELEESVFDYPNNNVSEELIEISSNSNVEKIDIANTKIMSAGEILLSTISKEIGKIDFVKTNKIENNINSLPEQGLYQEGNDLKQNQNLQVDQLSKPEFDLPSKEPGSDDKLQRKISIEQIGNNIKSDVISAPNNIESVSAKSEINKEKPGIPSDSGSKLYIEIKADGNQDINILKDVELNNQSKNVSNVPGFEPKIENTDPNNKTVYQDTIKNIQEEHKDINVFKKDFPVNNAKNIINDLISKGDLNIKKITIEKPNLSDIKDTQKSENRPIILKIPVKTVNSPTFNEKLEIQTDPAIVKTPQGKLIDDSFNKSMDEKSVLSFDGQHPEVEITSRELKDHKPLLDAKIIQKETQPDVKINTGLPRQINLMIGTGNETNSAVRTEGVFIIDEKVEDHQIEERIVKDGSGDKDNLSSRNRVDNNFNGTGNNGNNFSNGENRNSDFQKNPYNDDVNKNLIESDKVVSTQHKFESRLLEVESGSKETPSAIMDAKDIVKQFTRLAKFTLTKGRSEMKVQLEPKHLGKMTINLKVEDNKLLASIRVETTEAKMLIQDNVSQLKESLSEQNISIEKFDVYVQQDNHQSMEQHRFDELQKQMENEKKSNENGLNGSETEENEDFRPDKSRNFGYNTIELVA